MVNDKILLIIAADVADRHSVYIGILERCLTLVPFPTSDSIEKVPFGTMAASLRNGTPNPLSVSYAS